MPDAGPPKPTPPPTPPAPTPPPPPASGGGPGPVDGGPKFKMLAKTQEEEDAYDYIHHRDLPKPSSVLGSVMNMVKGALGAGVLSGHVAYAKAGYGVSMPLHLLFGLYMGYCLFILVKSSQMLYRRTRVPSMSYPDVGEAALACCPSPTMAKFAKWLRYSIDVIICIDLFGSCCTYQLIVAKTLKQLVEDTQETHMDGMYAGYPNLRVYLAIMIVPFILICLLMHLNWLAPFSFVANFAIVVCIVTAACYCVQNNPKMEGMVFYTGDWAAVFEFMGITVFSMSCAGVVLPVENNMRNPRRFGLAHVIGMSLIVLGTFSSATIGYAAYLDKSVSPITINFPMTTFPKILKGCIAVMIYVTHALNFWVPFNLCWYYLRKLHKSRFCMWELIYRAFFVLMIALTGIVFPSITALMGFLGAFCLSNMAFIWPCMIYLLVHWERPGFGKYYWRLWQGMILMVIGIFILFVGSVVNLIELAQASIDGTV